MQLQELVNIAEEQVVAVQVHIGQDIYLLLVAQVILLLLVQVVLVLHTQLVVVAHEVHHLLFLQ